MTEPELVPAGTYNVDPAHSTVAFEVKHMAIATVRGLFRDFAGTVEVGDSVRAEGRVTVASLDTGTEARDNDLRSPNFFDAAQFPEITFQSTGVEVTPKRQVTITGDITIKDATRSIELTGEVGESALDPWGNYRVGFDLQATIDRRDFGLKWTQTLANGNLVVANNVKLLIGISAIRTA